MVEKILNNYFTRKLLEEIKWCFIIRNLDYKFEDEKTYINIKVKPEKYDKAYYSSIICFRKDKAFRNMCNLNNYLKQVEKRVEDYLKEED